MRAGWGEVYRARDTKLGRDVAIKVLPEELSRDKERSERFEREARLLAQLNHQNIATLHGLDEHDGRLFLIMEVVQGETLAERIARGPIPLDEAIPLFTQMAAGLDAAHGKGIVHRDLKPANAKITPEDQIKILDFGLAKAFAIEQNPSAETSQSPTLTKGTALGVIMGTPGYMSPEQARGKPVDKRTDVWAFGCCLYEALTGKKAFDGETVTDIIAAVVNREPDFEILPAECPQEIRLLLERCLSKNARERPKDIGDLGLTLGAARERARLAPPPMTKARSASWPLLVLSYLILAVVSGVVAWSMRPVPDRPTAHLELPIAPAEQLGDGGGHEQLVRGAMTRTSVVISQDGRHLAFSGWLGGVPQLFHRPLAAAEARVLPGTEGALNPFFSPDGNWVGFWSGGELKKAPIAGGPVVTL